MRCWRGVRSLVHDRISSFPEGWEQALLGDIVQILDHHRVPVNADERALRVGVYPYYGANGQAGTIDSFLFDGDFALLAEDGGNFDDSTKGVAYRVMGKFWVNNHAHILAPQGGMSTQFLVYALNALNWMPHVSGTTRLKLTQGSLKKVPLSIPSLPEQRRIVAKIDTLQERSRKARAALEAIPPLLEQFRQSVLAAAFRGNLTADWRAQHPDVEPASVLLDRIRAERRRRWEEAELAKMQAKGKMPKDEKWKERYKEPGVVDEGELPELPEGWCWANVDSLSTRVSVGHVGSTSEFYTEAKDGILFLRSQNVRPDKLDMAGVVRITKQFHEQLTKSQLQAGDLLIVRVGANRGDTCVVPDGLGDLNCANIVFARPIDSMGKYISLFCQSVMGQRILQGMTTGSAQGVINTKSAAELPVPICPPEEQRVLIHIVQAMTAKVGAMQNRLSEALHEYAALDQSILAKAFRGELVPQDPNDEPASVLLDRIRAEREAQSAKPRAKKKTQGSTKHTKKAPPVSVNENDDLPLFNSLQK